MNSFIHIVCLDVPSPPDYGGAIDMYYKIVALQATGKKIILHYFDYKKERKPCDIEKYCYKVYSYKRKNFRKSFSLTIPYIINSRINPDLIKRLNEDEFPIILEGIHCTGIIPFLNRKERAIIRIHNNEAAYYKSLYSTESNFIKRAYFLFESQLLKKYQKALSKNMVLACLSKEDAVIFKDDYKFNKVEFIPCFIPWQHIQIKEGLGKYCLYHGNMSISENEAAALWLIEKVFSQLQIPLIIAGNGISKKLIGAASANTCIQLVNNPPYEEMEQLIKDAQINILPSFNNTGVKLKLLNALINGRFCITNFRGMIGSSINPGIPITIANDEKDFTEGIKGLFNQYFTEKYIQDRMPLLSLYNNSHNASRLTELL